MPAPSDVAAVLVTRGDVDMQPILDTLDGFGQVLVWDNAAHIDLKVYGRYACLARAEHEVIYVQDDDCLVDPARIVRRYEPGLLVANMPHSRWDDYPDSALVGWGSVFDANLPHAALNLFRHWLGATGTVLEKDTILRTADVIFSTITPHRKVDLGFAHREFAEGPDRMFKQPGHKEERDMVLDLARRARDEMKEG